MASIVNHSWLVQWLWDGGHWLDHVIRRLPSFQLTGIRMKGQFQRVRNEQLGQRGRDDASQVLEAGHHGGGEQAAGLRVRIQGGRPSRRRSHVWQPISFKASRRKDKIYGDQEIDPGVNKKCA